MRRLLLDRVLAPAASGGALALFLLAAGAAGCNIGVAGGDDGGEEDDGGPGGGGGDDGGEPPLEAPAKWVRGSLAPNFDLADAADFDKFTIPTVDVEQNGVVNQPEALTQEQFGCNVAGFTPVQQKMFEIEGQINALRNDAGAPTVDIIQDQADEDLALQMPWRATPTDVDCIDVNEERKCIVPLGGNVSTPGNTVVIAEGSGADMTLGEEIRVGVQPTATACHPDGVCFVANKFSNVISVIDMVREEALTNAEGNPVEIPVNYYSSDVIIAETEPGGEFDEEVYLFVANEWLGTVDRYDIRVVENGLDAGIQDVVRVNPPAEDQPLSTPDQSIAGVGSNPQRLKLDEQEREVYVANGRGGEVALIEAASGETRGYTGIGAPSVDIIEIQNEVFVSTTMPDRGLAADNDTIPDVFTQDGPENDPETGAESHQGPLRDRTLAYNFEDVKSGITQLEADLQEFDVFQQTYFTDVVNVDDNLDPDQRVITATLPGSVETDGQGQLFMTGEGNDTVQILQVQGGDNFPLQFIDGGEFETDIRPYAMFVDVERDELVVVNWGSGTLQNFGITERAALDRLDLGYNQDNDNDVVDGGEYPCSDLEVGQYAYTNTVWSNNGVKSCVSCHRDDLQADGGGFSNGVTAPTTYHKVIPCWNQTNTDNYFWTGAFTNDSYLSLAFAAQTRTNCELIAFALTEGMGSDPAQRVGDPNNQVTGGADGDALCRPIEFDDATGLPVDFEDVVVPEIARQKEIADLLIQDDIEALIGKVALDNNQNVDRPLTRVELSRLMDWWIVHNQHIPPNPQAYLVEVQEASADTLAQVQQGEQLFTDAGCANCHDGGNLEAGFTDQKSHGGGADWAERFVSEYNDGSDGDGDGIPDVDFANAQEIVAAAQFDNGSQPDEEVNMHLDMDGFMPFGFDDENALEFKDPLSQDRGSAEEIKRREIIELVNLADPERGHVPGYVIGQPKMNTPSLRGVWWNPSYMHHSMAKTFREAIVRPGHEALRTEGEDALFLMNGAHPDLGTEERGWAINVQGNPDAHGATSSMGEEELKALEAYVYALE
jgi:hypothetical protein